MLAHDVANNLAEGRTVLEPERIGFAHRLPHGDVLFHRPPIGPEKHLEKTDVIQLIDAERGFGVERPRPSVKGSGEKLRLMKGMFAASLDTRLLTSSNGWRYGVS